MTQLKKEPANADSTHINYTENDIELQHEFIRKVSELKDLLCELEEKHGVININSLTGHLMGIQVYGVENFLNSCEGFAVNFTKNYESEYSKASFKTPSNVEVFILLNDEEEKRLMEVIGDDIT